MPKESQFYLVENAFGDKIRGRELEELRRIHSPKLGIYNYRQSAEEMYSSGREAGYSPLEIGRQLNLEATRLKHDPTTYRGMKISDRFKAGANLAFKQNAKISSR